MRKWTSKNGANVHEGFLIQYGDPYKFFDKKKFRCSGRHIHGLIYTKTRGFWLILKNELVNAEIDVKKIVSVYVKVFQLIT